MILKAISMYTILIFLFYRAGLIINKKIKKTNINEIILYGFIFIACILQGIYIPLILLHVRFSTVVYITMIFFVCILGGSYYICPIKLEKKYILKNINKIKKLSRKNIFIAITFISIIIVQATISSIVFNENADDAFYVSLIKENLTSEHIYTKDPSTGIENTSVIKNYMICGYELFMSVISKIFNISPTILCHTLWIFLMIIFSYISYYVLMRKFFNNKQAKMSLIILAIIFLFSGFTTRLRGIILFSRMWQGKEIFLNIILNLILSNLVNFNTYNKEKNIIELLILNFSAVFFTNTAIFLVAFAYFGFAVIEITKKQWKNVIFFLITGIPIIIYGGIYLFLTSRSKFSRIK